jgi:hypothetical protein
MARNAATREKQVSTIRVQNAFKGYAQKTCFAHGGNEQRSREQRSWRAAAG